MFGTAGVAYVYLVYGMYDCLNVVTGPDGAAAAVLIRAVEPLDGVARMRTDRLARAGRRRAARTPEGRATAAARLDRTPDLRLASGPGLVAATFGLDTGWTGVDLCDPSSPLRLETAAPGETIDPGDVETTARIGVGYAGPEWADRPLRFVVRGHPSVSRGRPGAPSPSRTTSATGRTSNRSASPPTD